jgi:hypothetical protein
VTARLLIGLVALWLAAPAPAASGNGTREKEEAAKVAKKVAKAQGVAHQAEEEREALQDFQEEVAEYAALHAKQHAKLATRVTVDAEETIAAQKALAHAIEAKRAKASQGDIFGPEIEPLFRRLIAAQLEGPDALDARKAVREGNPGQGLEETPGDEAEGPSVPIVLRVNGEYPSGAPRSTVPASLLLTLPPLPESLQYRFVGRDLILVDSIAQIIVDFLPGAAPELTTK